MKYYAVFSNGSYTPLRNLEAINIISNYHYILKETELLKENKYVIAYEFDFVNEKGELATVRYDHWTLTHINTQPHNATQTHFHLYNDLTKTANEFVVNKKLPEALIDIFIKLKELSGILDYEHYSLKQEVYSIKQEILYLANRIDQLENK